MSAGRDLVRARHSIWQNLDAVCDFQFEPYFFFAPYFYILDFIP